MIKRTHTVLSFDDLQTEIVAAKPGTVILNSNGKPAAIKGIKEFKDDYFILGYDKTTINPIFWYSYKNGFPVWAKIGTPNLSVPLQLICLHLDNDHTEEWKQLQLMSRYLDMTGFSAAPIDPSMYISGLSQTEHRFLQEILFSFGYKWEGDGTSIKHDRKHVIGINLKTKELFWFDYSPVIALQKDTVGFNQFWLSLTEIKHK